MPTAIGQHNIEIHANAQHWHEKPLLRRVYHDFYLKIAKELRRDLPGKIVELGSGIGNLKSVVPDALSTDIFPNPWLDQIENGYATSFDFGSVSNLILFDVWHHLQYPGTALAEFRRILTPGGRLIIFDPGMGLLGKLIYGVFHHEPLGLSKSINWEAPAGFNPDAMTYYAAQGNGERIFVRGEFRDRLGEWRMVACRRLAALSYIGSGGFSGRQLYFDASYRFIRALDGIADRIPRLFSTRLLVVLERV